MKKIKREDSIWRGIFHMGMGTVLAQMINVLVQPILTRMFLPETLGIYTYIVSMATIVIPLASLKLDMLIVSEQDDREAQYITDVCIYINSIIAIIYLLVIFIGYHISPNNVFSKYGGIIYLVPVLVFTNGFRFIYISYNNRYKNYKLISAIAILREAIRAVIQLSAGVVSLGAIALSMGYALSPIFGLRLQMKLYLKKLERRKLANWRKIKEVIFVKGKRQILYLAPAQFINSFSSSLITISITTLFSAEVLGYYSAGVRILDVPILFITANVSKVCYQKISENVIKGEPVSEILLRVIIVLTAVSLLGFALLYAIAPPLSEIIFGKGYAIAGEYIRCLCVLYAVRLIATSFAGIYTVFKKQNFELLLNILLVAIAITGYMITQAFSLNIKQYLWFIGIGYTFVYLSMLLGYVYVCKQHDKTIIDLK